VEEIEKSENSSTDLSAAFPRVDSRHAKDVQRAKLGANRRAEHR
jgi:hypothetical protein